ncbi:class I SAM-dependent methyltransferase [Oceanirhabdus seepicola]|uniref:Class I SAM-dependent methyltransferase n=1 Tax=Oceanirhabdus seepicola TaxID=2828781 RepID=A0A9J6P4W2_9CLOT|nr:class I SAM-dependent methyltransferase [Oceanirhabdus seepicola]MCM1990672.1 class I SAM-dependent methyltransferase [Oceanirhabdus seepicola]
MLLNEHLTKTCPICSSKKLTIFNKYNKFTLLECEECKLIFQDDLNNINVSNLLSEIYDDTWIAMRDRCSQTTFIENAIFFNMLVEIFTEKKGDLLEIGAGTGEFLHLAKEAGWNVTGIDPVENSCKYAHAKFNLNIINDIWRPDLFESNKLFDVIVIWHVLEHIPNPIDFISQISRLLTPKGLLFICIPNNKSFTNKLGKHNSPLYTESDHLFHYSKNNLSTLIEKVNLDVVSIFSRQAKYRLDSDMFLNRDYPKYLNLNFDQSMALIANLQSSFEGHELYCIVKKRI